MLLAAAGILSGLEATTHWMSLDRLAAYGARPTLKRVVEQGKVITAAGVSSGIDMALTLAVRIAGDDGPRPSSSASSTTRSRRSRRARPRPHPPTSSRACGPGWSTTRRRCPSGRRGTLASGNLRDG